MLTASLYFSNYPPAAGHCDSILRCSLHVPRTFTSSLLTSGANWSSVGRCWTYWTYPFLNTSTANRISSIICLVESRLSSGTSTKSSPLTGDKFWLKKLSVSKLLVRAGLGFNLWISSRIPKKAIKQTFFGVSLKFIDRAIIVMVPQLPLLLQVRSSTYTEIFSSPTTSLLIVLFLMNHFLVDAFSHLTFIHFLSMWLSRCVRLNASRNFLQPNIRRDVRNRNRRPNVRRTRHKI